MELFILLLLFALLVWIVWKVRAKIRASDEAALSEAWCVVLDDPNYMRRRLHEEHKHEDQAWARKEAKGR
jgi:hypothetical protein